MNWKETLYRVYDIEHNSKTLKVGMHGRKVAYIQLNRNHSVRPLHISIGMNQKDRLFYENFDVNNDVWCLFWYELSWFVYPFVKLGIWSLATVTPIV